MSDIIHRGENIAYEFHGDYIKYKIIREAEGD